ncbi:MAG: GtrA family protein [Gammaproteobacteria bacterium]|nr:GtrA family protein [Gammaproteobacteria bacterium]MCY4338410.1 GtrA family protein [Gammaproteobacteria bacterium]
MLSASTLVLRYSIFAVLASTINILTQISSTILYAGRYELYVAILAGTGTGLITKYILDYHWIFESQPITLRGHSVKFALYSLGGVFTTCIFWGTQLAFVAAGDETWLRYTGAVAGLTIGYVTKYHLDKFFVFGEKPA